MAILGTFRTVREQTPRSAGFATAFAYVEDLLRGNSPGRARLASLAVGTSERVDLGEGVFAIEQVYVPKARPDGLFESHRKYIDLQVVVEGEERMEVLDRGGVTVREPYDEGRDCVLYEDTRGASSVRLRAGEAVVFFPVDVHMPCLAVGTPAGVVRKTVVKVPVT